MYSEHPKSWKEKENVLQLYLLVASCYLFLPEILVENMDII